MNRLRQLDWANLAALAVLAGVLAIAALISYTHLREDWTASQAPWDAIGPLTVDGLFAAAWLRMQVRQRKRLAVGALAWLALLLALAATIAGNLWSAWISGHRDPVSLAIATWPALAFALVWELVTSRDRRRSQPVASSASLPGGELEALEEKQARLLAEGAGRDVLSRELGISPWEARQLIKAYRQAEGGELA